MDRIVNGSECAGADSEPAPYRTLIENLGEGAGIVDTQERFVYANPAAERIFSVAPGGLLGRNLREFFAPEQFAVIQAESDKRRSNKTSSYEVELVRPDGERRSIMVTAVPRFDHAGRFHSALGVFRDTTDSVRAEEALLRERDFTAAVLETVGALVVVMDRDGRIVRFNRCCQETTGYTFEEVKGKVIWDLLLTRAEAELVKEVFQNLAGEGAQNRFENSWITKTGDLRLISWANTVLLDDSGQVQHVIGTGIDVTRQRQSEEALRESEERLKIVFEWAPDAIYLCDLQGRFLDGNRAAEQLVGYKREEVIGESVHTLQLLDAAQILKATKLLEENVAGRPTGPDEFQFTRKDGSRVDVEIRTYPVVVRGQQTVLGCARDITGRKRAERVIRTAKEEAEALNRKLLESVARAKHMAQAAEAASKAKSSFLANTSHEIRTPMNGILGASSLLLEMSLSGEQREYVEMIHQSAESLLTIINGVLDISKAEAGKMEIVAVPLDLRALTSGVVELMALEAESKGLELDLSYQVSESIQFVGDAARIRQVILNLVGNAVKFTERGRVRVEVFCEHLDENGAIVTVVVADTGIGIPEEKLGEVFDEFAQVDSSPNRRYGGTGLGLTISKRLAEMMGGGIDVRSSPGEGSTFRFRVPLRLSRGGGAVLPVGGAETDVVMPFEGFGGACVLVVEDNLINQRVATGLLRKMGCDVKLADNGREAVRIAARREIDAILMDCQMPEMDGLEATAEIRRQERAGERIPVIALTANAMEEDRQRCLRADMDDYLPKPVRLEDLIRVLSRWIKAPESAGIGSRLLK